MLQVDQQPGPTLAPGATLRPTGPEDEARALALLASDGAAEILATALRFVGGELISWRARQVVHQPGRGATVVYGVQVRWPNGQLAQETMVACSGEVPDGALVLDDDRDRIALWRFPYDPGLPGLAVACDEAAVASLLEELGLGHRHVRLHTRAYRPGRRAVIEATGSRGRLFVKVVDPGRVKALHECHRLLVASGLPVPQSLGWTPQGILVLQALSGRTLRQTLHSRGAPIPTGEAILALLDRFPPELARGTPRPSWLDKAPHYASVIGAALPSEAARAADLATNLAAESPPPEVVATHGDLYEKQLLVSRGRVSGLLDVDTAGPGDRLDDLACLVGHLSVLAQMDRRRASAIRRAADGYLASFEAKAPPVQLRSRVAAVVLSLATGPRRVQEHGWPGTTRRRLELAERWFGSAHQRS